MLLYNIYFTQHAVLFEELFHSPEFSVQGREIWAFKDSELQFVFFFLFSSIKYWEIVFLLSIFGRPVLDVKYKARQHSTLSMWNVIYLFNSDNCTRFLTGCFWHLYYWPFTFLGYNILYRQCKFIICYIFIVPAAKI